MPRSRLLAQILSSILLTALFLGALPVPAARAATLTVANTNDSGAGSLRAAVAAAVSGDVIQFAVVLAGQTIALTSGEILLDKDLAIDGASLANPVSISGGNASRVFYVDPAATVTLNNLKIINGRATDCATGTGACGGGILNRGRLSVNNCTFSNNTAASAVILLSENFDGVTPPALPAGWTTATSGGSPWVTIASNYYSGPDSAYTPAPGAISESSFTTPAFALTSALPLAFQNYYVFENGFDGAVLEISIGGGGFQDILAAGGSFVSGGYNGTLAASANPLAGRQTWTGLSDPSGYGFAYYVQTTVNLPAAAVGQSIQLRWRTGTDAGLSPAGAGQWIDDVLVGTASSQGGALYGGTSTITNSTFTGNTADEGGAIYNIGIGSTATNSTFSGNTAKKGGALYNYAMMDGSITLSYSTIAGNQAADGSGLNSDNGGNGFSLASTILANNTNGNCAAGTNYASNDYNISADATCTFWNPKPNDLASTNPLLGALGNNGGPTQTIPLLTGSPATDRIPSGVNNCGVTITADQRGQPRPFGAGCEVGAYETNAALTVTIDQATGQADPTGASPINFTAVFSAAVTGFTAADVTLGGTAPGTLVAAISGTGPTYNIAVSGMIGNGTVTASLPAGVVTDALGTPNAPSTSADNTVTFDATLLTVTATSPTNGAALTTGPARLTVKFNKNVKHAAATEAGSATNPSNYLLVEQGPNTAFDTKSCKGGRVPDDRKISINTVTYAVSGFTSTLNVNNGVPLPVGVYRLFVCGTTSIEDPAGNTLNGGRSDTAITFSVVTAASLPKTGFAPNRVSRLPRQPDVKAYSDEGMWLEIPSLSVKQSVVGVPNTNNDWDVTWLGSSIGYLEGTAFPTWSGNSVLTGHATDSNGKPGPFAGLGNLWWGSKVIIHAWGQQYIYEVRSVSWWTSPTSTTALTKHEELPWLTLITCRGYDEKTDSYRWRTVVRAVLVAVK